MRIHYYGRLDNLESCFTYQTFDIEGVSLLIQNSPRFGYEPATMIIRNPAMFIKNENGYFRFVIEDFEVEVVKGIVLIEDSTKIQILKEAFSYIKSI